MSLSAILLALFFHKAATAFSVPGDVDYYYRPYQGFNLIFSEENSRLADGIHGQLTYFHEFYEKEFGWKLDEKHALILLSPRNQIANAAVTPLPSLTGALYGGGAELVDYFSADSWVRLLIAHELTHMYQLNVKSGVSSAIKSVVGNTSINPLFPISYWIYPNVFAPTLLLEGIATYNESRFGLGGRLYSGQSRALLLSLLQAGRVNPKELINDHLSFAYGREKYLIGGFFAAFLAERFGDEKVNAFFKVSADHYINPLRLNRAFEQAFGASFYRLTEDFTESWRDEAERAVRSSEAPIAVSADHVPFTTSATGNHYTMAIPERDDVLLIRVADDGTVTRSPTTLPRGRVHVLNDRFFTATAGFFSPSELAYGLFDDSGFPLARSKSRYVYAQQGNNVLYADLEKSFVAPRLYWNGKDLGYVVSSAIFDAGGKPLYFKKSSERRVMMREETELFSVSGFYGFPVSERDGRIYFVAASELGSSLYEWTGSDIRRAHSSDFIVDAKVLNDGKVAIVEISARGYELKVSTLATSDERPADLQYKFKTHNPPTMDNGMSSAAASAGSSAAASTDPVSSLIAKELPPTKPYNSLRAIQFDGVDPVLGVSNGDFVASLNFRFSDPMAFNSFQVSLLQDAYDSQSAGFRYDNRRFRLNWGLLATVEEDPAVLNGELLYHDEETNAEVFFRYPIFLSGRHSVDYNLAVHYERELLGNVDLEIERYELTHFASHNYELRRKMLAFSPSSAFSMQVGHKSVAEAPEWNRLGDLYGAMVSASRDVLRDTSVSLLYQVARSDSPFNLAEFEDGAGLSNLGPTDIVRVSEDPYNVNFFELRRFGASITQGFITEIYSSWFPIGLRRTVVFYFYNEYYGSLNRDASVETLDHETGSGMLFEILFAHRIPILIGFQGARGSTEDDDLYKVTLKASF